MAGVQERQLHVNTSVGSILVVTIPLVQVDDVTLEVDWRAYRSNRPRFQDNYFVRQKRADGEICKQTYVKWSSARNFPWWNGVRQALQPDFTLESQKRTGYHTV